MKRKWLLMLVGGLWGVALQAQEEFVPPQSEMLTRFSFYQLSGGILILQARVGDAKDTLHFVLDTGSGGISLDSVTASRLQFPILPSEKIIRGLNGMRTVSFVYGQTLHLPGLSVQKLDFHVNDYRLLSSVYGLKIDGIIGFSFLRRYIVKIDFDQDFIEVFSPGTYKYPKGGYLLKPNFSTLPLQQAYLHDNRRIVGRFIFDTGAGLNMLLSEDFVADSSVFKKGRVFFPTQAEGLGGKKLMNLALLRELRIGGYKFKKVPVHVFSDDYNVTAYPQMGGLIGNDLMRRFNMIINYPEMSIHIKPNKHFNEDFDYSYTGLAFYLVNGEIQIEDVMQGSPAEKAGFQQGDIIFSVDKTISKDIKTYRNIFQNSLGRIPVMVIRNGTPMILVLDVKDIRKRRLN